MTFTERISDIVSFANMSNVIYFLFPLFLLFIYMFISSERKRFLSMRAKYQLDHMDDKTIDAISENYDVRSSKNIMHEEYETLSKQASTRKLYLLSSVITGTLIIASALALFSIFDTYYTAKSHGYRGDFNVTASSLWRGIHASPKEDKVPSSLENTIIIYYRFGCTDCEATYDSLSKTLSNYNNVYWIASRSKQGKKLLESYPVDSVPSGLYIRSPDDFLVYQLYKDTPNGAVVDTANLNNLLSAYSYNK